VKSQRYSFLHTALGGTVARFAIICVFFIIWFQVYKVLNMWGSQPGRAISITSPISMWPFIFAPWTALVYVFGGYGTCILPFIYNWRWPLFRRVIISYAVSSLVAFIIYAVWPVIMLRPDYSGAGIGLWLMRMVVSVDNPANCFPSSHAIFAVLSGLHCMHKETPRLFIWFSWILAAAVCVSAITVGQHYIQDIIAGVITAGLGYYLSRMIEKQKAPIGH